MHRVHTVLTMTSPAPRPADTSEDSYLTVQEAAERLNLSVEMIYKLLKIKGPGGLRAKDFRSPGSKKPSYRVIVASLEEFERSAPEVTGT